MLFKDRGIEKTETKIKMKKVRLWELGREKKRKRKIGILKIYFNAFSYI